jgi:hypothetical protein
MPLEALNTILAGGTLLVIGASAIAALVQLRHLRASNQLDALIAILQDWQKPLIQQWVQFVRKELPERLKDPAYLKSLDDGLDDTNLHPWLHLCDYYEQLGTYIKYGLIDRQSFLDVGCSNVLGFYRTMRPLIERARRIHKTQALFENFEYLAVLALEWMTLHPNGAYPKGRPRFGELERARPDGASP